MARSGPARDLWIEISVGWWAVDEEDRSGPARDLWIEIKDDEGDVMQWRVGSRKGPVD